MTAGSVVEGQGPLVPEVLFVSQPLQKAHLPEIVRIHELGRCAHAHFDGTAAHGDPPAAVAVEEKPYHITFRMGDIPFYFTMLRSAIPFFPS